MSDLRFNDLRLDDLKMYDLRKRVQRYYKYLGYANKSEFYNGERANGRSINICMRLLRKLRKLNCRNSNKNLQIAK